jgi:alkyldihydroxyacetonephosphate synthase
MSGYAVWGWGSPADEPKVAALEELAPFVAAATGVEVQSPERPAADPSLAPPRRALPASLAHLGSDDPVDRQRHAIGRAYRDLIRGIRSELVDVPDLVVRPSSEQDVTDVLDWATRNEVPVIPFGGGTSVTGGVEPRGVTGAVSLDLSRLSGLLEVDACSRAVRLAAGTLGPAAEDALKPHGLTLRFYPQSFERSSVGGWIATRAAGHFSTRLTHIDDLVESVRAVTPVGSWESRRLPGSGAGPSPDRMLLGSEGSLGVITEAWLRAQPRPVHRWSATFSAPDFLAGARAVRALVQAGLMPATCRLIDPVEAAVSGTLATGAAALVLGLESLHVPLDLETQAVREFCLDNGLALLEESTPGSRGEAAATWRSTFVRAPYVRESLVLLGILVETFETAVTWDRFDELVSGVTQALPGVRVGVRLTHVYPDGAAPYFTVFAPARRGSEVQQWDDLKAAASEAILRHGGTITHHHAVGRDHRPFYDRQRPDVFATAWRGAKNAVDPAGILNPGAIIGGHA